MAATIDDDVGELRGKVDSLERAYTTLDSKVENGFSRLFDAVTQQGEKTDRRIEALARNTDARLDTLQERSQKSTTERNAATMNIVNITLTGILGFGTLLGSFAGLVFAFYTLTKAPIDDEFRRQTVLSEQNATDIKTSSAELPKTFQAIRESFDNKLESARRETDSKLDKYVPSGQINDYAERQKGLVARMAAVETSAATLTAKAGATADELLRLRQDVKDNKMIDGVSRTEFNALSEAVKTNQTRLNAYFDKLLATPAYPCLDSGAGCGGNVKAQQGK